MSRPAEQSRLNFRPVQHELETGLRMQPPEPSFELILQKIESAENSGMKLRLVDFDVTPEGGLMLFGYHWRGHELVDAEFLVLSPAGKIRQRLDRKWFTEHLHFLPTGFFSSEVDDSVIFYLSSIGGYHGEINAIGVKDGQVVGKWCVGPDIQDLLLTANSKIWLTRFDSDAEEVVASISPNGETEFSFRDPAEFSGIMGVGLTKIYDGSIGILLDRWWLDDSSFAGTVLAVNPSTREVAYHGLGRAGYSHRTPLDSWWSSSFAGITRAPTGVFVSQSEFEWDGTRLGQKSFASFLVYLDMETGMEWRARIPDSNNRKTEITRLRNHGGNVYALDSKNGSIICLALVKPTD